MSDNTGAIFFAYKFELYVDLLRPRFYFAGLDPAANYTLHEINTTHTRGHWEGKSLSGRFLMEQGIELNLGGEYDSMVIRLTKN